MNQQAVSERKDFIIKKLIKSGFVKCLDGRQLYELSLAELENHYIGLCIHEAKNKPIKNTKFN
jgi:hypothetical protein